jgi:hypothetical protein
VDSATTTSSYGARCYARKFVCWVCGKPARADDPLTADHLVARADGGRNVRANYRVAHRSCKLPPRCQHVGTCSGLHDEELLVQASREWDHQQSD